MRLSKFLIILYQSSALIALYGCSVQSEPPEPAHNFKVSVRTEGRPVTDFRTELVHRFTLTGAQLQLVASELNQRRLLSKSLDPAPDQQGRPMGLKVTAVQSGSALALLGFEQGDVITAVNRVAVPRIDDLSELLNSLHKTGAASVTVQRQGLPHKLLYSTGARPERK